jgi:hypothetical protein
VYKPNVTFKICMCRDATYCLVHVFFKTVRWSLQCVRPPRIKETKTTNMTSAIVRLRLYVHVRLHPRQLWCRFLWIYITVMITTSAKVTILRTNTTATATTSTLRNTPTTAAMLSTNQKTTSSTDFTFISTYPGVYVDLYKYDLYNN